MYPCKNNHSCVKSQRKNQGIFFYHHYTISKKKIKKCSRRMAKDVVSGDMNLQFGNIKMTNTKYLIQEFQLQELFIILLVKVAQSCLTFATPWTMQSMEFSRPEYWSGQPFSSPGELPNPGIEPGSPTLQADSLPAEPQKKPYSKKGLYN